MLVYGRYNLIWCLTHRRTASRRQPTCFPRSESSSAGSPSLSTSSGFAGQRARIASGLGDLELAETAFREVQQEFFDRHMGYDAALVSLDLAVLYANEGRTQELKQLAAELMPVFESRDVHREAIAALLMFQHAAEEERLTAQLAQQLAASLRRERRIPVKATPR